MLLSVEKGEFWLCPIDYDCIFDYIVINLADMLKRNQFSDNFKV